LGGDVSGAEGLAGDEIAEASEYIPALVGSLIDAEVE